MISMYRLHSPSMSHIVPHTDTPPFWAAENSVFARADGHLLVPLPISSLTASIPSKGWREPQKEVRTIPRFMRGLTGYRAMSNSLMNFSRPQSSHLYNRYNDPFASPRVIIRL